MDAPLAIILAAGKSTRFKTERPKVLHDLCGRPMIAYVIEAARGAGAGRVLVVVGHQHEQVRQGLAEERGIEFVLQEEQRGTGHAVMVCREAVGDHPGPILILTADGPLVRPETLDRLIGLFRAKPVALVLGTAVVEDPTGYGRIVRDAKGAIRRIVEQKDATARECRLKEINASCYVFDRQALFESLEEVRPNNRQAEYYLTDCVAILLRKKVRSGGRRGVWAEPCLSAEEALGINDRCQMAKVIAVMQRQIQERWMAEGVTIVNPASTYIDSRATIGPDTTILPCTTIQGPVQIGRRCRIGPCAHLRGDTVLEDDVVVGAFVEVVRSRLGRRTRAKHLAYLGDAQVGPNVNVGAGTITANYDGHQKHPTTVEAEAVLGAGTVLVAPVRVGRGALTGAGAVVLRHRDVAPGSVVVGVPAREKRKTSP